MDLARPGEMDLAILADDTDINRRGFAPVNETRTTTAAAGPMFPPGRYGRRREPRRRGRVWAGLALVAVLAVAVVLSVRLYQQYGDPAYTPTVIRFSGITDSQVMITFRVHRPAGRAAVCAVRALDADGAVVGRAEVPVPADAGEITYRLVTTARPDRPEVPRCRPAG